VSLAVWDRTCHPTQVYTPQLTTTRQAGTRFTYPGGMEGWVDLCRPRTRNRSETIPVISYAFDNFVWSKT